MITLIKISLIVLFLAPALSYGAEYQANLDAFPRQLTQSLKELKGSVDKLSSSNEVLALKNTQAKARLNDLQRSLQKLVQENRRMTESSRKLQEVNPSRTRQVDQLEKTVAELESKLKVLNEQIKTLEDGSTQESGNSKEALLKMISQSEERQKILYDQILGFGKGNSGDQVQRLKVEIAQLKSQNDSSQQGWNEEQLHQMEDSVASLEKNRDELQNLLTKMQQKVQKVSLTQEQKYEQTKLESNIEGLKRDSKNLKFDLQELQQKMVELDKRKGYLEALLQK